MFKTILIISLLAAMLKDAKPGLETIITGSALFIWIITFLIELTNKKEFFD